MARRISTHRPVMGTRHFEKRLRPCGGRKKRFRNCSAGILGYGNCKRRGDLKRTADEESICTYSGKFKKTGEGPLPMVPRKQRRVLPARSLCAPKSKALCRKCFNGFKRLDEMPSLVQGR